MNKDLFQYPKYKGLLPTPGKKSSRVRIRSKILK